MTNNKITKKNRSKLQSEYIDRIVEGMDTETLQQFAIETLEDKYEQISHKKMQELIQKFAPDLLSTD